MQCHRYVFECYKQGSFEAEAETLLVQFSTPSLCKDLSSEDDNRQKGYEGKTETFALAKN